MTTAYDLTLAPGEDWNYGVTVAGATSAFATKAPSTGLTVTAMFCAVEDQPASGTPTPIDPSLSVACIETPPGSAQYNAAFAGADTLAHLSAYYDQIVYLCFKIGTQVWATLRVKIVRSVAL